MRSDAYIFPVGKQTGPQEVMAMDEKYLEWEVKEVIIITLTLAIVTEISNMAAMLFF